MAMMMDDGETPQRSLLDVVIEEYNLQKDFRTSRLLLTSQVTGSDKAVEGFLEEFLADHKKDNTITGVFALLDNKTARGSIHLLEAPSKVILEFLQLLAPKQKGAALLQHSRVCLFTEEVPREYPVWGFRRVEQAPEEFFPPKTWLKIVFESHRNFLELGRELGAMSKEKALEYITTTNSKNFLSKLPTVERVQAYSECDDLCSVEEYLEMYDTPVALVLEGEKVWPAEPFLKY